MCSMSEFQQPKPPLCSPRRLSFLLHHGFPRRMAFCARKPLLPMAAAPSFGVARGQRGDPRRSLAPVDRAAPGEGVRLVMGLTAQPCLLACRPACLLACLLNCLPACLPACLLACLPACLFACLPACVPACLLACLPARLLAHATPHLGMATM